MQADLEARTIGFRSGDDGRHTRLVERVHIHGRPRPFAELVDVLVGSNALTEKEAAPLREAFLGLRHTPGAPAMLLDVCACEAFVPAEPAAYAWLAATPSFSASRRSSRPAKP